MTREGAYRVFAQELEAVRLRYGFVVAGYVLMPEHVHLLVGEPRRSLLSVALQVLKQQTSRKLKQRGEVRFWQRRYYDFNVHHEEKRIEKLRYMHRNPVKRGLVQKPGEWEWSSFSHYATGEAGEVEDRVRVDGAETRSEHDVGEGTATNPTLRRKRERWGTHNFETRKEMRRTKGRPPAEGATGPSLLGTGDETTTMGM